MSELGDRLRREGFDPEEDTPGGYVVGFLDGLRWAMANRDELDDLTADHLLGEGFLALSVVLQAGRLFDQYGLDRWMEECPLALLLDISPNPTGQEN